MVNYPKITHMKGLLPIAPSTGVVAVPGYLMVLTAEHSTR
jgi:hypothetical protein